MNRLTSKEKIAEKYEASYQRGFRDGQKSRDEEVKRVWERCEQERKWRMELQELVPPEVFAEKYPGPWSAI